MPLFLIAKSTVKARPINCSLHVTCYYRSSVCSATTRVVPSCTVVAYVRSTWWGHYAVGLGCMAMAGDTARAHVVLPVEAALSCPLCMFHHACAANSITNGSPVGRCNVRAYLLINIIIEILIEIWRNRPFF
jgi:hypothetical protein